MGVLSGIRVLDLTRVLAGPYCTMLLGDMGAEIIKVERPDFGDDSRAFGPFVKGESGYFMGINRNKKSVILNLKDDDGIAVLKELVKSCDVVVENFKPGTMEKLGIGYDVMEKLNPSLIYCSISGFGQTGPYSARPAYDAVVQAMSGIMSITGEEGGSPTRVGSSIGDITAGLYGAIGILGALYKRTETGLGEMIDIAMLDCQVSILENAIAKYTLTSMIPKSLGNRHSSIVPFEDFGTKDGKIMIAVGNDKIWKKFCECIDRIDLVDDPRFATNPLRFKNYAALKPILDSELVQRTTQSWITIFTDNDVPNGPINSIDKVLEDEHLKARKMFVTRNHKTAGETILVNSAINYRNHPNAIENAAPLLGEHTEEVLSNIGVDESRIWKCMSN